MDEFGNGRTVPIPSITQLRALPVLQRVKRLQHIMQRRLRCHLFLIVI